MIRRRAPSPPPARRDGALAASITALPAPLIASIAALVLLACEVADIPRIPDAPDAPRVIETDRAPPAIGPYSQGILVGNTLYLAGQLGMDPETGELVEGGIVPETRRALDNLGAVLEAAGFGFEDVVQSQVFLADLEEFGAMNEVYAGYFGDAPPARATVEAARLPRDARVEIMLTAVRTR